MMNRNLALDALSRLALCSRLAPLVLMGATLAACAELPAEPATPSATVAAATSATAAATTAPPAATPFGTPAASPYVSPGRFVFDERMTPFLTGHFVAFTADGKERARWPAELDGGSAGLSDPERYVFVQRREGIRWAVAGDAATGDTAQLFPLPELARIDSTPGRDGVVVIDSNSGGLSLWRRGRLEPLPRESLIRIEGKRSVAVVRGDVVWTDADGTQVVATSGPDAAVRRAAVAPDGTRAAIVYIAASTWRLAIMPWNGGVGGTALADATIADLADTAPNRDMFEPVWSPTGAQVAVLRQEITAGRSRLEVVTVDSGAHSTLGTDGRPGQWHGGPSWSDDGTSIFIGRGNGYEGPPLSLDVIDPATGALRGTVKNASASIAVPGGRLALSAEGLYRVASDGSSSLVAPAPLWGARPPVQGDRGEYGVRLRAALPGVFAIDPAGSRIDRLTTVMPERDARGPLVLPDASLLFYQDHTPADWILLRLHPDGRTTNLGALPRSLGPVSPDGTRVVRVPPRGASTVLDLATLEETPLFAPGGAGALWSPDGARLAGMSGRALWVSVLGSNTWTTFDLPTLGVREPITPSSVETATTWAWVDDNHIDFLASNGLWRLTLDDRRLERIAIAPPEGFRAPVTMQRSPDGRSLVVATSTDLLALDHDRWRSISSEGRGGQLAWSRDSSQVAYLAHDAVVVIAPLDGSGAYALLADTGYIVQLGEWLPDGRLTVSLAYYDGL